MSIASSVAAYMQIYQKESSRKSAFSTPGKGGWLKISRRRNRVFVVLPGGYQKAVRSDGFTMNVATYC